MRIYNFNFMYKLEIFYYIFDLKRFSISFIFQPFQLRVALVILIRTELHQNEKNHELRSLAFK